MIKVSAMGAGGSVRPTTVGEECPGEIKCVLKGLREAIEEAVYVQDRWPVIIDTTGQAGRFLRYQNGSYLLAESPQDMSKENLRARLVGCLGHGGNMTVAFTSLSATSNLEAFFHDDFLPRAVLDRAELFKEETWSRLLRPEQGDPEPHNFAPRDDFRFIILTASDEELSADVTSNMAIIRVVQEGQADRKEDDQDSDMAELFGAKEIRRNSPQLVEAGFDGELDEVKKWLDKGFYIESTDGRGHTALSEAASQGQDDVLQFLLAEGANPNALNDTGRSGLWRACYNGHITTVKLLLEAGGDPAYRDKVSHEGAYDVAKSDDIRTVLSDWNPRRTEALLEERRLAMRKKLEERLTTAAARDAHAREIIRDELIEKAVAGDLDGLRAQLLELAEEAERTGQRPRGTCEVRDQRGMTLLSLTVQHGRMAVAEFLLTHWSTCDEDRQGLTPGTMSWDARVTRANPNSRDLKGWNPAAIAVFHESKACLELLLRHGANPSAKSSYNKSAWDMAQDELDAAGRVVKSRAEIRGVIEAWERESGSQTPLQGQQLPPPRIGENGVPLDMPEEGSATLLAVEVAAEGVAAANAGPGKSAKKGAVAKKHEGGKKARAAVGAGKGKGAAKR